MVLRALVGGGKGAETERASCVSPWCLLKNSGLHALEVPQFHRKSGGLFRFPPVTYTHSANCAEDRHGVFLVCWGKVSIRLYVRWVTFAWRLALFTLRVSVRGLSYRTPDARGVSTGAVLGLVATCPSVCRTAEARGDSTGAVLGLLVTCPLLF